MEDLLLQWAAIVVPTLAVIGLFLRLGGMVKTIQGLESDSHNLNQAVTRVSELVIELRAWRDASKSSHNDLLERVRRLESIAR